MSWHQTKGFFIFLSPPSSNYPRPPSFLIHLILPYPQALLMDYFSHPEIDDQLKQPFLCDVTLNLGILELSVQNVPATLLFLFTAPLPIYN